MSQKSLSRTKFKTNFEEPHPQADAGLAKTVELTIAGLPFKLRSSHDEETVKELVQFVDAKMKQAMTATKSGSFQSAAVLAALNIAEELILLKRKAHHELDILEEKTLKISQDLENSKVVKASAGHA
jgi:cell division protein ZapA